MHLFITLANSLLCILGYFLRFTESIKYESIQCLLTMNSFLDFFIIIYINYEARQSICAL